MALDPSVVISLIGAILSAAGLYSKRPRWLRWIWRREKQRLNQAERSLLEVITFFVRVFDGCNTFEREALDRFLNYSDHSLVGPQDRQARWNSVMASYRRLLEGPLGNQVTIHRELIKDDTTLQREDTPFVDWGAVDQFTTNLPLLLDQIDEARSQITALDREVGQLNLEGLRARALRLDAQIIRLVDLSALLARAGLTILGAVQRQAGR